MDWRRRGAILIAFSLAVPLAGALFLTLGRAHSLGVVAVALVLTGLYQLRRIPRRALVYDRRPATPLTPHGALLHALNQDPRKETHAHRDVASHAAARPARNRANARRHPGAASLKPATR